MDSLERCFLFLLLALSSPFLWNNFFSMVAITLSYTFPSAVTYLIQVRRSTFHFYSRGRKDEGTERQYLRQRRQVEIWVGHS